MLLEIVTTSFSDLDKEVLECILTQETKYTYIKDGERWYVMRFSKFVYIHHRFKQNKNSLMIEYRPSYQKEIIDIPVKETSKALFQRMSAPE